MTRSLILSSLLMLLTATVAGAAPLPAAGTVGELIPADPQRTAGLSERPMIVENIASIPGPTNLTLLGASAAAMLYRRFRGGPAAA